MNVVSFLLFLYLVFFLCFSFNNYYFSSKISIYVCLYMYLNHLCTSRTCIQKYSGSNSFSSIKFEALETHFRHLAQACLCMQSFESCVRNIVWHFPSPGLRMLIFRLPKSKILLALPGLWLGNRNFGSPDAHFHFLLEVGSRMLT